MLRMSFMPSDFHPILLVLGDRIELMAIADILREFARDGRTRNLSEIEIFSSDTVVELVEHTELEKEKPGLIRKNDQPGCFEWKLPRSYAADFADDISILVEKGEVAGSVTLECEVLDEIVVKISFGEWEDGYLSDHSR